MELTKAQKDAINISGHSILVSAAAGSGKTKILVDRIIKNIMDKDKGYNIDEILVMTFTKLAAREMKERLKKELYSILKDVKEEKEYKRIKRQINLLDLAKISTIDSFCLSVVKDNISKVDLDPSFKIADSSELFLLEKDVMKNLLEEEYEKREDDFNFISSIFSSFRGDESLASNIESLYNIAMSMPDPLVFVDEIAKDRSYEYLVKQNRKIIEDTIVELKNAINIIEDLAKTDEFLYQTLYKEDKKTKKAKGIYNQENNEKDVILSLETTYDNETLRKLLDKFTAYRISFSKEIDEEVKNKVKNLRDFYKGKVEVLKYNLSFNINDIKEQEEFNEKLSFALKRLTKEYIKRVKARKLELGILDFSDVSHYALEILYKDNKRSDVAKVYQNILKEIYIDEYQDSSFIQEEIVKAIENNNVFMVGDVKQSIYRFRQARPEIFVKKYDEYEEYEEDMPKNEKPKKIILANNFRSRENIINISNYMFFRLMRKEIGDIDYTDKLALKFSASFSDLEDTPNKTLFTYLKELDKEVKLEYTSDELEAKVVAKTIKDLLSSNLKIQDERRTDIGKKEIFYRKVECKDIVILLKKVKDIGNVFAKELTRVGIPCHLNKRNGFFESYEIKKFLAFLMAIDNPSLEVPMLAFLKSHIIGLSDKEIAGIITVFENKKEKISNIVFRFLYLYFDFEEEIKRKYEKGKDEDFLGFTEYDEDKEKEYLNYYNFKKDELEKEKEYIEKRLEKETLNKFIQALYYINKYAKKSKYENLNILIRDILDETSFLEYVLAMKNGEVRKANLLLLVEKAKAFAKTSYGSLFNFIRYMEDLKKSEKDFGEASIISENANVVKIMTIHSSKGLQFPICILADLSREFRFSRDKFAFSKDFGLAFDYINRKYRTKEKSLKKYLIEEKNKEEEIGEELRLLYVAMTRAKEMLIFSSADDFFKRSKKDKFLVESEKEDFLEVKDIMSARSYLDFLSLLKSSLSNELEYKEYTFEDIKQEDVDLEKLEPKKSSLDEDKVELLLDFEYPYKNELELVNKISVSALKDKNEVKEVEEIFTKKKKTVNKEDSLRRGNIYHKILEKINFTELEKYKDIFEYLKTFKKYNVVTKERSDFFSDEDLALIDKKKLEKFIKSTVFKLIKEADINNNLYREKEFYSSFSAKELGILDSEKLVLVQGVVDVFIEDEDGIILIDYKSDKVKDKEIFKKRYKKQLEYYEKAIKKAFDKNVKKKIIWSLHLGDFVEL